MNDEELIGIRVDPVGLWRCGASYFPQIGSQYARSAALLTSGSSGDSAYTRLVTNRTSDGVASSGPVPGHVKMVVDELSGLIHESVTNLFDTGDALEKIAWAYADLDEENGAELRRHVEDELEGNRTGEGDPDIWTDEERQEIIPPAPQSN